MTMIPLQLITEMYISFRLNFCRAVCITTHLCTFIAIYFMIYKLCCFLLGFLFCIAIGSWVLLITNHKPATSNFTYTRILLSTVKMSTILIVWM